VKQYTVEERRQIVYKDLGPNTAAADLQHPNLVYDAMVAHGQVLLFLPHAVCSSGRVHSVL